MILHLPAKPCLLLRVFCYQVSPGEALTKDELQSGVDVANEVAESYQKCMCIIVLITNLPEFTPQSLWLLQMKLFSSFCADCNGSYIC